MTRFNTKSLSSSAKNLAGGNAYATTNRFELLSILFTSFLKDQFYRSSNDTTQRIKDLVAKEDPLFAAKAALYARNTLGMRSVSHLVAAEIARSASGKPWAKRFYQALVHRPDDMTETLACYMHSYGKPVPNAMKKGFAKALEGLNEYKLAKYRMEGNDLSMVDVVNLVHPKATEALTKLMKGELKNTDTWEARLSEAGQSEDEADTKSGAWSDLLKEKKLGYMALLRNLRNILEQSPESVGMACEQLQNKEAIEKSLVLPFRFSTAYDQLKQVSADGTRQVITALAEATELSLSNVPKFRGKTLIAVDASGSMQGDPIQKAALFAAVLYKTADADLMLFANDAEYASILPNSPTLAIADGIKQLANGGGTNFFSIFEKANRSYDRIIILSDMQGWMHSEYQSSVPACFDAYKKRTGSNPHLYSFDLTGYGPIQFPQNQVYCLAGFSDKILAIMSVLEEDKKALEHAVEAVQV